ncbi:MAG: hypothetical protein CSA81_15005, partial [Acidobacteria bacterium]
MEEKFGYKPEQVVDFKALRGDASDNIPGIKGVGEKTALDLIQEFGTVEKIYQNLEKIKPTVAKKLKEGKDSAWMSYDLATIRTDVPIDFDLAKSKVGSFPSQELLGFFKQLGFHSLIKRLTSKSGIQLESDKKGKSKKKEQLKIKVLEKESELEAVLEKIQKTRLLALEPMWQGGSYFSSELTGLGLAVNQKEGFFVGKQLLAKLEPLLRDRKIKKVGFNLKAGWEILTKFFVGGSADEKLLKKLYDDFDLENFFDVQLAIYVLEGTASDDLEKIILRQLGEGLQFGKMQSGQGNLLFETDENQKKAAAEKAALILELAEKLEDDLKRAENLKESVLEKMEVPLVM